MTKRRFLVTWQRLPAAFADFHALTDALSFAPHQANILDTCSGYQIADTRLGQIVCQVGLLPVD